MRRVGVFLSQLHVEQNPFVLADVDPPAAVLALAVPLGPVWRQDDASGTSQVASTLSCREAGGAGGRSLTSEETSSVIILHQDE